MRLRPEPPRVTRLSRKVLAGLGLAASLGVGGALIYALQNSQGPRERGTAFDRQPGNAGRPQQPAARLYRPGARSAAPRRSRPTDPRRAEPRATRYAAARRHDRRAARSQRRGAAPLAGTGGGENRAALRFNGDTHRRACCGDDGRRSIARAEPCQPWPCAAAGHALGARSPGSPSSTRRPTGARSRPIASPRPRRRMCFKPAR